MSGIPSWAVKGAKVVCVDDCWPGPSPLAKGITYTILQAHQPNRFDTDIGPYAGDCSIELAEVDNPFDGPFKATNRGFGVSRFRPLISLETDIATHFRQHLDVREPVEA